MHFRYTLYVYNFVSTEIFMSKFALNYTVYFIEPINLLTATEPLLRSLPVLG